AGVADPELDVVEPVEGQEVLGLLVGVLVDDGAALVRRAAGDGLGHRAAPVLCADAPVGAAAPLLALIVARSRPIRHGRSTAGPAIGTASARAMARRRNGRARVLCAPAVTT